MVPATTMTVVLMTVARTTAVLTTGVRDHGWFRRWRFRRGGFLGDSGTRGPLPSTGGMVLLMLVAGALLVTGDLPVRRSSVVPAGTPGEVANHKGGCLRRTDRLSHPEEAATTLERAKKQILNEFTEARRKKRQ